MLESCYRFSYSGSKPFYNPYTFATNFIAFSSDISRMFLRRKRLKTGPIRGTQLKYGRYMGVLANGLFLNIFKTGKLALKPLECTCRLTTGLCAKQISRFDRKYPRITANEGVII